MTTQAVTITDLAFAETVEVPFPTPLDPNGTATVPNRYVTAKIDVAALTGYDVHFEPEAIGNRMVGYSLSEEKHAVETLVRECVFSWLPELQPADPQNAIDVQGGLDDRITVAWGVSDDAIAAVLQPLADRIAAAVAIFTPEAPAPDGAPVVDDAPPSDPPVTVEPPAPS